MPGQNWQESADWERVARFVKEARTALGLRQKETETSAGTWTKIENAKERSYKEWSLAQVERDLKWLPGTIRHIAAGGLPITTTGTVTAGVAWSSGTAHDATVQISPSDIDENIRIALASDPELGPELADRIFEVVKLMRRPRE